MFPINLADMRTDYQRGRLRREDLKSDAVVQLNLWLKEGLRRRRHRTNSHEPCYRWE
jgi:hypothetical protein